MCIYFEIHQKHVAFAERTGFKKQDDIIDCGERGSLPHILEVLHSSVNLLVAYKANIRNQNASTTLPIANKENFITKF